MLRTIRFGGRFSGTGSGASEWEEGAHAMTDTRTTSGDYGASLLALGGAAGLGLTLAEYFLPGGAIAGTDGALLVVVTSGLILAAALVILAMAAFFDTRPAWLRILLDVLLILGLAGTAFAAYFLETNLLIVFMAIGFIGWLAHVVLGPVRARAPVRPPGTSHGISPGHPAPRNQKEAAVR